MFGDDMLAKWVSGQKRDWFTPTLPYPRVTCAFEYRNPLLDLSLILQVSFFFFPPKI